MSGLCLRLTVAWLLGVSVGCSSAPVRYYTLTAPPDSRLPASKTSLAIDVRVVHTPPQLRRDELMVRTGPTEVTLLDNERWASPVNDEIRDALRLALQRRLGHADRLPSAFTRLTLDVDVHHLEAELGRYALLELSWSATLSGTGQQSTSARFISCAFNAKESVRTGFADLVEGYQREIAALADAIVTVLTTPASGVDARCQESIEGSSDGPSPRGA